MRELKGYKIVKEDVGSSECSKCAFWNVRATCPDNCTPNYHYEKEETKMSTRYVSKEVYARMKDIQKTLKDILQEHGGEVAWYSVQSNTSKERYRVQGIRDVEHSRFITSICVIDGQCVVHDILPESEPFWDEDDAIRLIAIQSRLRLICANSIPKDMTTEGGFVMSTDKGSTILLYKGKVIQHCSSEEMKAFIDNLVELDDDRRDAEDE